VNARPAAGARPIAFRFGLTGRRWGEAGPAVLLLHTGDTLPSALAQLIEPLLASGHQVIALDDPTDAASDPAARVSEYASAAQEAAIELRSLEAVAGHGLGAAAAAQALANGLPAVRLAA
jgi:alpha-beta hydrolase superfamily lysophospholipase